MTQAKVTYFITERAKKVAPATIDRDFFALKHYAILTGCPINSKDWDICKQVRKGIRKVMFNGNKRRVTPTTWEKTLLIISKMDLNDYNSIVIAANICLASLGCLRKSEAFAASKNVKFNKNDNNSCKALYMDNLRMSLNVTDVEPRAVEIALGLTPGPRRARAADDGAPWRA